MVGGIKITIFSHYNYLIKQGKLLKFAGLARVLRSCFGFATRAGAEIFKNIFKGYED